MSKTLWEIQHDRAIQYQNDMQERQMVGVVSTLGVLGVVGGVVGGICAGVVGGVVGAVVGFGCFYVVAKHGSDAVETLSNIRDGAQDLLQDIQQEVVLPIGECLENLRTTIADQIIDFSEKKPHKQPESSCVPSDGQSFSDLWMRLAEECCVGRRAK